MATERDHGSIGFIGLGSMGLGMAERLLECGFSVTGHDIHSQPNDQLVEAGGHAASSSRAVVEDSKCDVLIVMVATAAQATQVLLDSNTGAAASLPKDAVILLCITASPEYAKKMNETLTTEIERNDLILLDCPVSGGANRARDGTLSILASGVDKLPEKAEKVLNALSANLFHVPGLIGGAFALKMVHQILVGVHIIAAVETTGLAMAAGLDLDELRASVMSSDAASWLYGERVPHMSDLESPPFSSLAIILKDLDLLISTAQKKRHPVFLSTIAQQTLLTAKARGLGTHDDCATLHLYNTKATFKNGPNAAVTQDTIHALLKGIHLAAALEAFSLVEVLDLDTNIFHQFVLTAAGASDVFKLVGPQIVELGTKQSLSAINGASQSVLELAEALASIAHTDYAASLSWTALNFLHSRCG